MTDDKDASLQSARDWSTFAAKACGRVVDRILDANRRIDSAPSSSAELKAALNDLSEAQKFLMRAILHSELSEEGEQ